MQLKSWSIFTIISLLSLFSACSKTETPPEVVVPKISISATTTANEGNGSSSKAAVTVSLSEVTTVEVSFKWSTTDGTAIGGQDFTIENGALIVLAPGELYKNFAVDITGDNNMELDETFTISISEVLNATLLNSTATVTITDDDTYIPEMAEDGPITPISYPGMTLIWSDEFDGTIINTDNWSYNTGAGGWGNNELETYTNTSENSFVLDGKLNIVATRPYPNIYRSARMVSQAKQEFTYGRIDIRAKMPFGQGIWPALWMLGGNISSVGWPKCGEIDIMEYLGHDQTKTYGTAHYDKGGHQYKGGNYTLPNSQSFHDLYHVFSIIWTDNAITWYVDYKQFYQVTSTSIEFASFRLPQFFIMNVAVGGNWPGYPDATTTFPQTMFVDYVRVFQ
ncbi:MAG: family 16 glycosylhydrolase [Bacteroidales bacterium]|nr:family 16 glycosylhydrolase [Bacteroidales bacterium]